MARRKKKLDLKSGDDYVDWTFKQFLEILNNDYVYIYKVKKLRDPDNRHKLLHGFYNEGDTEDEIYLAPSKKPKYPVVTILIHELAHALFGPPREKAILRVEEILSKKFTDNQKEILASFIPEHFVKKQPK